MDNRSGITLIELIIAIGIVAILSVVSMLFLQNRQGRVDLDSTTQQVATLLRQAQTRATQQVGGTSWGVYFSNSTTTQPFYALFSSATYATSTQDGGTYALSQNLLYATSTLASGATTSVVFAPGTGTASTSTTIKLLLKNDQAVSSTLTISPGGLITY